MQQALCVFFFIAASGFQGQLFFGSGQTLAASLVETIEGARRPGRRPVQLCKKLGSTVFFLEAFAAGILHPQLREAQLTPSITKPSGSNPS